MESYMTDKRLVDYKDFTHHSKYAGRYTDDKEFYNNAKPFVHLKLDQACRKMMPEISDNLSYDYDLYFDSEKVTLGLEVITVDERSKSRLLEWKTKLVERINSLAISEFGATDAFPEDEYVSNMLKALASELKQVDIKKSEDGYFLVVAAKF